MDRPYVVGSPSTRLTCLVIPDPDTAIMDPFMEHPTLSLICNIVDPVTKERYTRDPRNIAHKAEAYLKYTKIGDTCLTWA